MDPYFWLRDRSNPDVVRYLEDENRYTEAVMQGTEPLQQALYEEMLARIQETDLSVPEKLDDYEYYSRTEKGKQYPIYCRKAAGGAGPEEILLDVNALARGRQFFSIGAFRVSPDHRMLAYSSDTEGAVLLRVHEILRALRKRRRRQLPGHADHGSLNDSSVPYWEPAKWTARRRSLKKDGNLLLLKTNLSAGHGRVSGRYERLKETAFEYTFLLERLGIESAQRGAGNSNELTRGRRLAPRLQRG